MAPITVAVESAEDALDHPHFLLVYLIVVPRYIQPEAVIY
jgi:hypothetical protein